MSERSYSHKSDGRQSSAGQSVHSATSGRANSFSGFGPNTPLEPPGLAPGLFILGSVPAIIRCWLDTNFKHDSLLYAAVCTGSYSSYVDLGLVERLGFEQQTTAHDGERKIKLPMYLPEAVPMNASSRSNSPIPQLPSLSVDFTIVETPFEASNPKCIQIFLGSDVLRAHNADVLLSTNQLTLYDDDRSKLQIPLVRPEDDRTFKSLYTTSRQPSSSVQQPPIKKPVSTPSGSSVLGDAPNVKGASIAPAAGTTASPSTCSPSFDQVPEGQADSERRASIGLSTNHSETNDMGSPVSTASRAPSAIWSNWRREPEKETWSGSLDWASLGKANAPVYQRRDTGIKVLKPKAPSRALSSGVSQSSSPSTTGQSRFFDEGKRRTSNPSSVAGEKAREGGSVPVKTRATNPVGGASAFAWLNSGGQK